jgi:hypothetical protein
MPDRNKTPDDKTRPVAPDHKNTPPDSTDDRPQREDEYLSKFLQNPSPESGAEKADKNNEKKG